MKGVTEMTNIYRTCVDGKAMQARSGESLHSSPTSTSNDCVRASKDSDIANVVDVHLASFQNFFLTFLGRQFLEQLYREIAREPGHVFLVAMGSENEVIGFVAGVPDLALFFRRLARKKWLTFGLASIPAAILHPSIVPRLLRALNSSSTASSASCPATLMSLAVAPEAKGKGVGKCLVERFTREMAQQGIRSYCLTTDRDHNEATNSFYRKLGFAKTREYQTQEGRWMCEYVISTQS
jgi:ribosomal protein S18 acetylase RimI-like enzyme